MQYRMRYEYHTLRILSQERPELFWRPVQYYLEYCRPCRSLPHERHLLPKKGRLYRLRLRPLVQGAIPLTSRPSAGSLAGLGLGARWLIKFSKWKVPPTGGSSAP